MTSVIIRTLSRGVMALAIASIGGCGDDKPAAAPSATKTAAAVPATAPSVPQGPYRVVKVEHPGQIAGACRLVGHPEPAKLRPWPAMGFDETRDDESVVVGEKSALGGCVVSLAAVAEIGRASCRERV